jgi:hypothetical protein
MPAGPPHVPLLAIYLHKYFAEVESVTEPSILTFQPFGILGAKLVTPQTNRFMAYYNTAFSQ